MSLPRVSLQALEAFERVAATGSMLQAAQEMGLSVSSISHHIARLEDQLRAPLLDRSARPLALTREGKETLRHLTRGLDHLRRATSETAIGGLSGVRSLQVGVVEDFESNGSPELAVALANQMPNAKLSVRNVLSHQSDTLLRTRELDIAITADQATQIADFRTLPLIRDPFVVAAPSSDIDPHLLFAGQSELPFLRFNRDHLIGAQIEAHLARNRITLADRYAFDSAQSIMAMIASGAGWSIITPLGFMRAHRFMDQVSLHPLPIPDFARMISLKTRQDDDLNLARAVAELFRRIVNPAIIETVHDRYPWLKNQFGLADMNT